MVHGEYLHQYKISLFIQYAFTYTFFLKNEMMSRKKRKIRGRSRKDSLLVSCCSDHVADDDRITMIVVCGVYVYCLHICKTAANKHMSIECSHTYIHM